jgi:antitoxin HigA-1
MIVSYRDGKTERLAIGEHVKEFSGFARQAGTRLDRLDAATSLQDLAAIGGNRLEALKGDRGPVQHPYQRPVAELLRMARRVLRPSQCRDHGLSLKEAPMARTPIHPGEHLAEELRELGISAAELARQIEVPVNRVTEIMNGQRGVTADTALRLGHWFGTSPEYWLNLQKLYELRLAREEVGDRLKKLPTLSERKRRSDSGTTGSRQQPG